MKKKKGRAISLLKQQGAVLGLDCSSATIGWGLISLDFELLSYGHIKPLGSKFSLIERLNDAYSQISSLCDELKPQYVAVEDIFTYMQGKSQAKTITILAAFNRVSALAAFRKTNSLNFYSVHEIRKFIKEHYDLPSTIGKEDMPETLRQNVSAKFENMINKKGNIAKETFDEADGIATALACVIDLNRGNK